MTLHLRRENEKLKQTLIKMSAEWAELLAVLLASTPEQMEEFKTKLGPQLTRLQKVATQPTKEELRLRSCYTCSKDNTPSCVKCVDSNLWEAKIVGGIQ